MAYLSREDYRYICEEYQKENLELRRQIKILEEREGVKQ